ncbi:MAG: cytochrome P450, partial [bacterium]
MQTRTELIETRGRPIPRARGGWPILGDVLAFHRDPVALLENAWREYGEVFQIRLAGRALVVFAGPEAHDAYFHAPDRQLSAREVYQFTVPIFGKGVAYDVAPELMAEQLGFLAPLLKGSTLQGYARLMHEEIEAYTRHWAEEGEIDLPKVANELTINIASRCLLGAEIRASLETDFAPLYHDLQGGINTLGFFLPLSHGRGEGCSHRSHIPIAARPNAMRDGEVGMETTTAGARARQLLLRDYQGVLSTLSVAVSGYPFGSVVPYCLDRQGRPIIL